MAKQIGNTTRDKILKVAARQFAQRGYDKVTTREIAKDAEINPASIYHHFPSKEDILDSLYALYSLERESEYPDLSELMQLAETEPPHDVLLKSIFRYSDKNVEMLDQILITAARGLGIDPKSERFIRENIFESVENVLKPLLERLIDLGRVKPLDVDLFIKVLNFYCFSVAAFNKSTFRIDFAEFQKEMALLFSLVEPCHS
ncbi:MAG: TetR/AcrR family transcriptional regulator [Oscillospiraceae bacterium]|nr:TetR/AcrR family transcriptional regulator [Oscillospiraceae bacterium]